jgi:hypothetical protein
MFKCNPLQRSERSVRWGSEGGSPRKLEHPSRWRGVVYGSRGSDVLCVCWCFTVGTVLTVVPTKDTILTIPFSLFEFSVPST